MLEGELFCLSTPIFIRYVLFLLSLERTNKKIEVNDNCIKNVKKDNSDSAKSGTEHSLSLFT